VSSRSVDAFRYSREIDDRQIAAAAHVEKGILGIYEHRARIDRPELGQRVLGLAAEFASLNYTAI
jgi:hypothetical protein